jgi:hypothetical protein
MLTVYNPLTGQWERLDDVARPLPVIARDTWLVAENDNLPFVPSLGANSLAIHTDIFGNTDGNRANIGIARGSTGADIVIPDPWRVRRFIVMCSRTSTGTTSVSIVCSIYGRLLAPDGSPTSWRFLTGGTDTTSGTYAIRFNVPSPTAGVFGYDQYRIVFRRDPDSTPTPQLSLIRVFLEF